MPTRGLLVSDDLTDHLQVGLYEMKVIPDKTGGFMVGSSVVRVATPLPGRNSCLAERPRFCCKIP